jgi:hexosaminidase
LKTIRNFRKIFLLIFSCLLIQFATHAQVASSRKSTAQKTQPGYGLLPVPQQMELIEKRFSLGTNWKIVADPSLAKLQSVTSLQQGLKEANLPLNVIGNNAAGKSPAIQLIVKKGAVEIGATVDTNRTALANQAYKLSLKPGAITITANAQQGLYYGVQTFLQLLKTEKQLPEGEITDWPNVELRMIYWDDWKNSVH